MRNPRPIGEPVKTSWAQAERATCDRMRIDIEYGEQADASQGRSAVNEAVSIRRAISDDQPRKAVLMNESPRMSHSSPVSIWPGRSEPCRSSLALAVQKYTVAYVIEIIVNNCALLLSVVTMDSCTRLHVSDARPSLPSMTSVRRQYRDGSSTSRTQRVIDVSTENAELWSFPVTHVHNCLLNIWA
jgi:hypothetical protein